MHKNRDMRKWKSCGWIKEKPFLTYFMKWGRLLFCISSDNQISQQDIVRLTWKLNFPMNGFFCTGSKGCFGCFYFGWFSGRPTLSPSVYVYFDPESPCTTTSGWLLLQITHLLDSFVTVNFITVNLPSSLHFWPNEQMKHEVEFNYVSWNIQAQDASLKINPWRKSNRIRAQFHWDAKLWGVDHNPSAIHTASVRTGCILFDWTARVNSQKPHREKLSFFCKGIPSIFLPRLSHFHQVLKNVAPSDTLSWIAGRVTLEGSDDLRLLLTCSHTGVQFHHPP